MKLPGFDCCRVCGKLFPMECAVTGGILGGEWVPTSHRGPIPVCRDMTLSEEERRLNKLAGPSCRQKLEAYIEHLVRKKNYEGLKDWYKDNAQG